jgi:hypothetical protein
MDSNIQLRDLGPVETEIEHQTAIGHDKPNDKRIDRLSIDRPVRTFGPRRADS